MRNKILVLLAALLLDEWIGEPHNRWHPVVWMGTFITRMRKNAPKTSNTNLLLYGGSITFVGSGMVGICAALVVWFCRRLPFPLNIIAQAWLLKTTFSLRGLNKAALEVEGALRAENLTEARRLLSWHLVSRDTSKLDEALVASAAISSVAENTSDGIIAPLLWYSIGGIPAALVYRYANTGDSILGYRDQEREWLGKIPARTDDLLNIIPARLTALLFVMMRPSAWAIWRRDAHKTASPNAGHPMSAMAGVLDVELEKVDHYLLNAGARQPNVEDLRTTRRLMYGVTAVLIFLLMVGFGLRHKHD
ncbi:MAG: cobalamin biosynthesis protein CobD [Blastochloris sp.]|nr:cobalamin biosynthesis protein CobD [Blastochloris sp.]